MNLILLGPPGAGKGTQGERLKTVLGVPHVASGDMFRAITRERTPLAREIQGFMERGEYVPDQLTIELVLRRLTQPDAAQGFILDGFPRTEAQAEALDHALKGERREVDYALHITAPRQVLLSRLAGRIICSSCHAIYNEETRRPKRDGICDVCGHQLARRSDEELDTIRIRLDTYIRQTEPMIAHYRSKKNCLIEINGSLPILDVEFKVDSALRVGSVHSVKQG